MHVANESLEQSVEGAEVDSNQQRCSEDEDGGTSKEGSSVEEVLQQSPEGVTVASEDSMKDVRTVVNDLVNYVVYEETSVIERKHSLLLQNTSFPDSELASIKQMYNEEPMQTRTTGTPPRMVNISETVDESDDTIIIHVVRRLVREVLRQEKEDLKNTLDRRRKRSGIIASSNFV
ncbi:hypothetical protein KIN20_029942 [Parelaphostrongylus tenuis]|uniref:Uncharacterized protein n=1 Tax=Parelaphostrongylus tenuis TaxID=148309 RepID=A0AAD5WG12_PARTN|nr:hypothetical protein KIN20_029942 [Parelaphostrongylus tenuis]